MSRETQVWLARGGYLVMVLVAIVLPMLPLGLTPDAGVMPDLYFAITYAWMLRRPDTLPLPLIAVTALLCDIMLMRPVGLWALYVILATEYLRLTHRTIREQMFALEWLSFGVAFAMGQIYYKLLLSMTFAPTSGAGLVALYWLMTVLAYPCVVAILHYVMAIRAPRPVVETRLRKI